MPVCVRMCLHACECVRVYWGRGSIGLLSGNVVKGTQSPEDSEGPFCPPECLPQPPPAMPVGWLWASVMAFPRSD